MADDIDAQAPETPAPPSEFNWDQFFSDEAAAPEEAPTPPQPVAVAPAAPQEEYEEEEQETPDVSALQKQVEELTKQVAATSMTTAEIQQKARVTTAMESWKQQASPAELAMSDMLAEATSLEDLKLRSEVIKRATATHDDLLKQERVKIEREVQLQAGLPVPPTFQPIPEKQRMEEALGEGDIDKAAAIAVQGLFNR